MSMERIEGLTQPAVVRVGRDVLYENVLLAVTAANAGTATYYFDPLEAEGLIEDLKLQLQIIRDFQGAMKQ